MFKLVKNSSTGANVGEPILLPIASDMSVSYGEALLYSGTAITCPAATTKPHYIVMENAAAGEKDKVHAMIIQPSMIFETTVSAAPTGITVGDKLKLDVSNSHCLGCGVATGGAATVVDLCGATAAGDKILVRFV